MYGCSDEDIRERHHIGSYCSFIPLLGGIAKLKGLVSESLVISLLSFWTNDRDNEPGLSMKLRLKACS